MIARLSAVLLLLSTALRAEGVSTASGAVLRALDKFDGTTQDLEVRRGDSAAFGRLEITLGDCRYPTENPAGEAYAALKIVDSVQSDVFFSGWILASSPALNAIDHPRYDVWVMRCTTS